MSKYKTDPTVDNYRDVDSTVLLYPFIKIPNN